jgi:hypothetical protein
MRKAELEDITETAQRALIEVRNLIENSKGVVGLDGGDELTEWRKVREEWLNTLGSALADTGVYSWN